MLHSGQLTCQLSLLWKGCMYVLIFLKPLYPSMCEKKKKIHTCYVCWCVLLYLIVSQLCQADPERDKIRRKGLFYLQQLIASVLSGCSFSFDVVRGRILRVESYKGAQSHYAQGHWYWLVVKCCFDGLFRHNMYQKLVLNPAIYLKGRPASTFC